jgi:hypothetical protein
MSLIVTLFTHNETIDINELEKQIPAPYNDLFGFEVYRKTVWGSNVMKELGCKLIASLSETDIFAYGEDLQELKRECHVILSNIDHVVNRGIEREDFIVFRINNVLEAIKVAEKYDDVGVWIG